MDPSARIVKHGNGEGNHKDRTNLHPPTRLGKKAVVHEGAGDINDQTIRKVLSNLTQYSTPPRYGDQCQVRVSIYFSFLAIVLNLYKIPMYAGRACCLKSLYLQT